MEEDNVNPAESEQAPPPKIRLGLGKDGGPAPAAGKPDTSRIDLADAEPSTVEAPGGGEPMSVREVLQTSPATTVRPIPVASPKAQTSRISIHETQPARPGEAVPMAKTATSRIPLRDSQPLAVGETVTPAAPSSKVATGKVATGKVATGKVATGKVATGPVAPATGGPAPAAGRPVMEEITSQAQFNRTARISIEGPEEALPKGGAVGDTGRIPVVPGEPGKAAPPKTIRLTRPAAAAPKTVIPPKTEGATPKTIVLKRPGAAGAPAVTPPGAAEPGPAAAAPKTVVLRKPEEGGGSLEEKGATSRITVPEGTLEAAPPTQRKTIRIKRLGEGGAGPATAAPKTIALVRPKTEIAAGAVEAEEGERSAEEIARELGVPEYDEPSALYGVIALLTMLVLGAALYVLAAQTLAPTLPFPGKIL